MTDNLSDMYDVVVVGGGAAGLSGALTLARSRRSVLVTDAGEPCNALAAGVHGFLTRDGMSPSALLEVGRSEVQSNAGQMVDGRVSSAARDGDAVNVTLDDGRVVTARRLLVTTGLTARALTAEQAEQLAARSIRVVEGISAGPVRLAASVW